jgi:hypothetical protein
MHFGFISFCFSSSTTLFAKVRRIIRCVTCLRWAAGTILLFCCVACQSSPEQEEKTSGNISGQGPLLILQRAATAYDQPSGQPIAALQKGDKVVLTSETSQRLYPQTTKKDTLLEPFLRVILPDQEPAWIYANPADFVLPTKDTLQWQWHNRLQSVFSAGEFTLYEQIWEQWDNARQAGLQLLTFQAIRTLRNQLEIALRNYPLLPEQQYEGLFPGTLAYQDVTGPGWWIDFNQWAERCANIPGADAELALFQFYQKEIYPPDGIEYHFHSWDFPVNLQQKHSLLGRNIHFNLLLQTEQLTQQYPFLQTECEQIKDLLLHDISASGTTYWEDWPAVELELDTILNTTNWSILSKEDLATIRHRRQTLALPKMQELYLGKRNK